MSVLHFKIVAIIAIFVTGILGGLLSRALTAGRNSELVFALGNAFAGGVFLEAGIIIGEEFAGHHNQWLKFALVALGLGLMAVVAIWT